MSIINEALKKVQTNFHIANLKKSAKKSAEPGPQPPPPTISRLPAEIVPVPVKKNLATIEKEEREKKESAASDNVQRFSQPVVLKKAQEKENQNLIESYKRVRKSSSFHWQFAFLLTLCFAVLAALIFFSYPMIKSLLSKKISSRNRQEQMILAKIKKEHRTKKIAPGTLDLQGIVLIKKKPFALINNEIYEVGDEVEDKTILKISSEEVRLADHGKIKVLKIHSK